jgi:outer membrane autotransporter protein
VANTGTGLNFGTLASLANSAGTFGNSGTISGPLAVSGGAVTNAGAGTVAGATTITGGTVANAGTMAAVTNAAGFANTGTAGAVVNTGTGTNAGTLASLDNAAAFTTTGTIAGAVANSGALSAAGLIGGDITNAGSFLVTGGLTAPGANFDNIGGGTLAVSGGDFTGLATLDNMSSAEFGVTVDAGRTLGVGTLTNFAGAGVLNNGTIALGAATLINQAGATFTNNGAVTGPVVNFGTLIASSGSSFGGGTFRNEASGLFRPTGSVSVGVGGGAATNAGVIAMANGSTADRLSFGGDLAAGGTFTLDANLTQGAQSVDVISVAGATSGTPAFAFTTTGAGVGQSLLFFDTNGGTFTLDPALVSGLTSTGSVISSVAQAGPGADLFLITQANPAIGGLAANISLTQSLITTVVNRPTSPLVDLGRVEGEACRSGGFARLSGGEATVSGTSNNGFGEQSASVDASYGSIQAGWDYGCYDGRFDGWDLAFGGQIGLTNGSSAQDIFQANPANAAALTGNLAGILDTDFDQQSAGLYMAARRDRFLADVQLRYDNTDFDFTESTVAGATPIGLNGATASSQSLTLAARVNYVYPLETPGLSFIPNAGFSYTNTNGDTVSFTDNSGQSLVLNDYSTMIGFAGGTLARTVAGESGREATTTFLTANYYQDFGDDPTSVFYDGLGASQTITSSNIGGFGEIGIGLNYFADVSGRMGGVQRLNAAVRADIRAGENVSDAYALTAQFRLSF